MTMNTVSPNPLVLCLANAARRGRALRQSGTFKITARQTVTNPAERAARLATAYSMIEQKTTAVMGDLSGAQPTTAACDTQTLQPERE